MFPLPLPLRARWPDFARSVLLTAATAAAPVLFGAKPIDDERPPNLLLILADDHRADALGIAGHPFLETPNLDRLARGGAWFRKAFVTTSLCSPSRATILTGLHAHQHRVVDNYSPLPEDLVFFPARLKEHGYETAFIGKWHMGGDDDAPRPGFDHWVAFKGQGVYYPLDHQARVRGRFVPQSSDSGFNRNGTERLPQHGYITDELTDFALDWLSHRAEPGDRPFFLMVSHKAVHADFIPADRHAFRHDDQPVPRPPDPIDQPDAFHEPPMWVRNQRNSRHGTEFAYYSGIDLAQTYRRYCETILALDESVGRLITHLESSGEMERTLVLYLGDNGFLFGEHGLIDKRCAYEESIRIPLLLHWPARIPPGRIIDQLAANIDVAPTMLDAAGVPVPPIMIGRSLLPLARGATVADWRTDLLYEYYWERNYPQTPTILAVRGERYKFIRNHGVWDTDELYDLETDPLERRNLVASPEHEPIVERMRARLFDLLGESGGMELPIVRDRGTQFLHRRRDGSRAAPFPERFHRDPDPATPDR